MKRPPIPNLREHRVTLRSTFAFALLMAASTSLAWASSTETFIAESYEAFDAGELDGAILDPDGIVRPGPALTRTSLDSEKGFSALATNGTTAWAGTGQHGRIYRLRGGKLEEIFASKANEDQRVTALAHDGQSLWAGFAPSGRLVRIDPAGKVHDVQGIEAKYIWSIRPGRSGVTVTTGIPAALVRVSNEGTVRSTVVLKAEHAMDSAEVGGDTWVATALPGRVVVLHAGAKNRTLFQLGTADEVRRLVPGAGGAYFIANRGAPVAGAAGPGKKTGAKKSPRQPSAPSGSSFGTVRPPTKAPPSPRGSGVWHLSSNGAARVVTALGPGVAMDAAWFGGRGLLVALSKRGRAVLIYDDGNGEVLVDVPEAAIEALALKPDGTGWAATSGGASVVHIGKTAPGGTFQPAPIDAQATARVGRVDLVGTRVSASVRTGPSPDPSDGTWSDYAKVGKDGIAKVPLGRFLQVRVKLDSPEATLRALRVAWRTPNLVPRLGRIDVVDRKLKVPPPVRRPGPKAIDKSVRDTNKSLGVARSPVYTAPTRIGSWPTTRTAFTRSACARATRRRTRPAKA